MSRDLPLKTTSSLVSVIALLLAMQGQAAERAPAKGASPALCGKGDIPEPGIQGDVPAGQTEWKYNCGLRLVGELPRRGNVQGAGKCAYVRVSSGKEGGTVYVIDVSKPAKPVEVSSVPVKYASETMRVIVTNERAVLVSGSSVYDIKDCLNPVLMGEIKWPPLALGVNPPSGGGGGSGLLPHDLRVNHAGTKVYGSFGLWEVDITNLRDPESWKVTDHRCHINSQIPGPWQEVHRWALKATRNLCDDAASPRGANYRLASSGLQANLIWPTLSHSLDVSGDDTKVFVADQAPGGGSIWQPTPMMRIIDVSQQPVKVLGEVNGPGHGLDWFRAGGRDYVLHSNEGGTGGMGPPPGGGGAAPPAGGLSAGGNSTGGAPAPSGASMLAAAMQGIRSDTCKPYPRSTALGWAFEALISDVTNPAEAKNVSMLQIAINDPDKCDARKASGRDPWVAYHLIDNPMNAHFAAVNFNSAGLRIYDIRQPAKPSEVAYFNHGPLVHGGIGYYDAARGLIYAAGGSGFWVLELEPQVRKHLGL